MAGYYPSCEEIVVAHDCDPCTDKEYGRIRSAAYIRSDYVDTILADPDNATLWAAGQNDDLKIIVIPKTHGEFIEPSEIVGQGYGDQLDELISYDQSMRYFDPNFINNCDFYNEIKRTRNYHGVFRTSSRIYITQVPVTVIPKMIVADDLGSVVEWNVLWKWRYQDFACPYDVPTGIFDACFIPNT